MKLIFIVSTLSTTITIKAAKALLSEAILDGDYAAAPLLLWGIFGQQACPQLGLLAVRSLGGDTAGGTLDSCRCLLELCPSLRQANPHRRSDLCRRGVAHFNLTRFCVAEYLSSSPRPTSPPTPSSTTLLCTVTLLSHTKHKELLNTDTLTSPNPIS